MMKRLVIVLGSILALLLGACSQIPGFTPTPGTGPTVDSAATSDALFKTAVAQTLTAQPTATSTSVPITETAVIPVASPTLVASDTPAASFTPSTDLTTTPATATGGPATATLAAGQVTAIWTLAVRKYGTQPPLVPFSHITLINKAKAEAYISLHVDLPEGGNSVIEYPVEGTIKIEAPVGFYSYVAWVGGRKMVGNFRLQHGDDLTIILYRDKVVIK
jgi:hypothetical protein